MSKTVQVLSKQKPWLHSRVQALLKPCDSVFKSGELQANKQARISLKRDIREAKRRYKQLIEEDCDGNNSKCMWQGIKTLSGYEDSCTDTNFTDSTFARQYKPFLLWLQVTEKEARTHSALQKKEKLHTVAPISRQIHHVWSQ